MHTLLCPFYSIHTHNTHHLFNCTHIITPGFVDGPCRGDCIAGQMNGEAGWWTTSGNIGIPPLARIMGVGRQQQQQYWSSIFRPDAIPGVNHMYGMQYQIVRNIILWAKLNFYSCTSLCVQFLHKIATLIYALNCHSVASYNIPGLRQVNYVMCIVSYLCRSRSSAYCLVQL